MKKILMFVFVLCTTAMCGCSLLGKNANYDYDYQYDYNEGFVGEDCDPFMEIDGKLTEDIWKDKQWYSHYKADVTLHATTFFTKKGLYIGAYVDDNLIYHNNGYAFARNTYIDISIAEVGQQTIDSRTQFARWSIDSKGDIYNYNARPVLVDAKVMGDPVNSGTSEGMAIELFVTWDALGYDEIPEKIMMLPRYGRTTSEGSTASSTLIFPGKTTVNDTSSYYEFDAEGYAEGSTDLLGNSALGAVPTNGWDFSSYEENGLIKVNEKGSQWIFVKESLSDKYSIEATVTTKDAFSQSGPVVGLMAGYNNENGFLSALTVDGRKAYLSNSFLVVKNIEMLNQGTKVCDAMYSSKSDDVSFSSGVKLKVIKDGNVFYYYVNEKLVNIEKVNSELNGDTSCGLFAINCKAIFKDVKFVDYQNNELALKQEIEKQACIINLNVNQGGMASTEKPAIMKGESLELELFSGASYSLSRVLINGADRTAEVRRNIKNGVYTIPNVQTSMNVELTYEQGSSLVAVNGTVKLKNKGGGNLTDTNVILESVDNPLAVYKVAPNDKGIFTTMLKGGSYNISYELNSFTPVNKRLHISQQANTLPEVTLYSFSIGGSGNAVASQVGWDYSRVDEKIVRTGTANQESYTLFSGLKSENYYLKATISDLGMSDSNPGVGFVAAAKDGGGLAIMLIQDSVRVMEIGRFDSRVHYTGVGSWNVSLEPVELTLIKQGAKFSVFVNDSLAVELTNQKYKGEVGFGFYRYCTSSIEFSNYSKSIVAEDVKEMYRKCSNAEWNFIDDKTMQSKARGECEFIIEDNVETKFIMSATMQANNDRDSNPSAGFIVAKEGSSYLAISLIDKQLRVITVNDWNSRKHIPISVPINLTEQEHKLTVVRNGNAYKILVDDELVYETDSLTADGYTKLNATGGAVGVYKNSTENILFKDITINHKNADVDKYFK